MPGHVLEKDPSGRALGDDAGDVGPEVAGVILAAALAGGRKRLAGVSGGDGIHDAAPRAAAEDGEVSPDRGGAKVSGALACDEAGAGVFVPLDVGGAGKARLGKLKTHVKAAAA